MTPPKESRQANRWPTKCSIRPIGGNSRKLDFQNSFELS